MSGLAELIGLVDAARSAKNLLERQLTGWPSTGERQQLIVRLDHAIAQAEPLVDAVLTVSQLAAQWNVSTVTVRGYIDDGQLDAFNVGRGTVARWRITVPAVLRFAARGKKTAGFHGAQPKTRP